MGATVVRKTRNLNFTVPVGAMSHVDTRLVRGNQIRRTCLNVRVIALSPRVGRGVGDGPGDPFAIRRARNILVTQIVRGSPTTRTNLQTNSIVITMRNRPMRSKTTIRRTMRRSQIKRGLSVALQHRKQRRALGIHPNGVPDRWNVSSQVPRKFIPPKVQFP